MEVSRLASEQRALRRVATLVAAEAGPQRVFTAVSEECARVLGVNASAVMRFEGHRTATIVGRHNRDSAAVLRMGDRIEADEASCLGRVLVTRAPARIDNWDGARGGQIADAIVSMGYRSSAAAPIMVAGVLWGAITIASEDALPEDAEVRLAAFCELASLAVASAQARADLIASRKRLVEAGDEQRRRLERNLHDGAQQHLVSVALKLRELARGLHPVVLSQHGLQRALGLLAQRLPLRVKVDAPAERLPAHIEATAYYIAAEALTNVVKHAGATRARVVIRRDSRSLRCQVFDDGRGGADPAGGSGIVGLCDRAEAEGGTLTVASPPGQGTVVTATLPLG